MGSMILLAIGGLEIDWGKNHGFRDHSSLYQAHDVAKIPYYYVDESGNAGNENEDSWRIITEFKDGLTKPLAEVIDRINLLGHTLAHCKNEFLYLANLNDFDPERFKFEQLSEALTKIDVQKVSSNYGYGGEDFGKFFRREIYPRLELSKFVEDPRYVEYELGLAMENLSPYTILQLLSPNPSAQGLPVNWSFNDLEENGWAKRSDFIKPLEQSKRFLVVTEGSSDAAIIKHALSLLKPHISDFFDFVDMQEGYPFSGTGSLINFVKGLISISVQNNVIVLFDNDAAGVSGFNRCIKLKVPNNMRVLKLPYIAEFENFETIGPNGRHQANINGQGAAIECYLSLDKKACVRWNNYESTTNTYQGELIGKDQYKRIFLEQREKVSDYDYSKILSVLNMIIAACTQMQEEANNRELAI